MFILGDIFFKVELPFKSCTFGSIDDVVFAHNIWRVVNR